MKGFYTLLMGLMLLLNVQQLGAQTAGIAVGNASGSVGQEVCLPITGTNFSEVLGFQFSLDYDPAVLQFSSSTGENFFGQNVFITNSAPGDIRLTWSIFSNDVLTDAGPFQIGEVCFTVLQEAETTVNIVGMPIAIEINTLSGQVSNPLLTNSIVNQGQMSMPTCTDGIQNGDETGVDCGGPDCGACPTCSDGMQNGDETGVDCGGSCTPCNASDLIFDLSNASGNVGTEVCIDVTTRNFTAIGAFQFSINYDPARLEYQSATNLAFSDINVVQPSGSPGDIRTSWVYFNTDNLGGTIADNGRVFTLCFTVLAEGNTPVLFSNTPIGIEAFDNNNMTLTVSTDNGRITGNSTGGATCSDGIQNGDETGVDCGGSCAPCQTTSECGAGSNNVNLCVSDECAEVGEQACVDVVVTNFMDITGMEFRVNFPGSNLDYASFSSNAAFTGGVNVNPSGQEGQLTVLWFDPSNEFLGIDIPDGEVAMTFCFEAENTANSSINLSLVSLTNPSGQAISPIDLKVGSINGSSCGGGTATCNDGIQNGDETGVDCGGSCTPCSTGGVCGEGSNDLNYCIDDVCADVGTQVCLDIDVTNFTSVAGFQFSFNYPAANLEFVSGSSNPDLPGGGASINGGTDGEVTVLWFDGTQEFNGGTLADGSSLVNLCFTVQSANTSVLDLSEVSTSLPSGTTITSVVNPGSVNAPACSGGGPTCSDGIQNGNETGVDCGGPDCAPCQMQEVCGEGSNDLNLCIEDACADVGSQVCVDVNVTNFTTVAGFQFTFTYPAAILDFVSGSSNPDLPGGGASINGGTDGEVTVLWFDGTQEFNGGTLDDGSSLINLCFTVETAGVANLDLTSVSTSLPSGTTIPNVVNMGTINAPGCSGGGPTCSDGIQNGNETGVDCGGPDCAPCQMEEVCGEGSSDLNLCIEDACADVGSQVCVDVNVTNFTTVAGFQFTFTYPAAILDFVSGSSNPDLPGGGASINGGTDGEVTVLWFDGTQEFNGGTLDDGSSLINLCFTVETAGVADLDLTSVSTSLPSGTTIPNVVNMGTINAPGCSGGGPTCSDGIQNGNETGIDCGGPDCAPCSTGEQGDLTLNVGSASANLGEEVCVNVTVVDFDNVGGLNLSVNYDATRLQLISAVPTGDLSGFTAGNFDLSTPGTVTVNWTGAGQALPDNGTLFELCFVGIGAGSVPVTIANGASATDGSGASVTALRSPGTIVLNNNFDDLTFIMGYGFGDEGSQVCLDVPVYNFNQITSFSFTIQYDPTKVSYESLTGNPNFPTGGGFQVSNPSPGEVRVIWLYNPPDFAGITVPDGTNAFSVCFDVIESCETLVELTDNPTSIAATDNNGNSLGVTVFSGGINAGIPCGGCSTDNLILDITDGFAQVGQEVCLDMTAENFSSLTDLQFTLNYDAAILAFERVENFGLGSIGQQNFTIGPAGRIVFDWSSPSDQGQSIGNGGTVFTLCFTVSDLQQTPVNFANSPVPILAASSCSQNIGVVPNNGLVNSGVPTGDDLTLQLICGNADVGEEICLPIRVFNFEDILGFQFSLDFDPDQLEFLRLDPDPAVPMLVNESAPGDVRVNWSDLSGASATIPDGGILGTFCFRAKVDTTATVAISNQPIPTEFLDDSGTLDFVVMNCAINGSGAPMISNAIITPPTCNDSEDAQIELTVTGPSSLAFNWVPNPNNSSGRILTNVGAGTYMVEVVNTATGERVTESFVIQAPPPFNPVVEATNVTCFQEEDGRITVSPVGGVPPYLYDWSGNLADGVPEQTGLPGGLYSVSVTDANGCQREYNNIQITAPSSEISIPGLITNITETPGSVTVQALGATGTVMYSWTGPDNFSATTQNITGLMTQGTYCVTIVDENGCTAAQCYNVDQALRIAQDSEFNSGCAGLNNGFINLTVVGGEGNYTYSWTGPDGFTATSEDISGLAPGTYMVTVTSDEESVTNTFTLEPPTAITLGASVFPATTGANGRIVLTPNGGTGPYTYEWSNDATTAEIDNLTPGEYCVTVTDSQGCTRNNCYTVEAIPLSVAGFSSTSPTCAGGMDGTASVIVNGGAAPFVATTTPGDFTASSNSDTITINLPAGTYTISVVDDQGSEVTQEVTVVPVAPVVAMDTTIVSDTEDADCTGGITLMIAGGSGPYTVEWNVPALSGPQVTGLCAGTYEATITDASGCVSETIEVTIGQLTEMAETTTVECPGDASGMIDLTVSGGVSPYSFSWRVQGSDDVIATTEDLSNVTDGFYIVTITDATGATLVRTYEVETGAGFSLAPEVMSDYNGFGVSCAGASDGSLMVDVSGLGTYSYEWFVDEMLIGMDSVLTGREAGTYTVVVTSEGGCTQTAALELTEPDVITIQSEVTNVSCVGERDGAVSVAVSGGVSPFSYLWSNGTTLPQIQFLRPNNYDLTVTDANGCVSVANFSVLEPTELVVTSDATDADDGCNGTVTILPLGEGDFNYSWEQLPNQGNNNVATDLCPGDYTVEVFDDLGCQSVTVRVTVRDRRFPCLSERNVITPNGDGLNESFILFCSDGGEVTDNSLEIYNRWGQLVYRVADYNCSEDGGLNCFEGRTNDGSILPEGAYYYVLDYSNPAGERQQKRGSISIIIE